MSKFVKVAAASSLLLIGANASADTFQAAVNVLSALAITENTQLDFGNVGDDAGTTTCVMATGGSLSGTNTLCSGTATPGAFTITGSDAAITVAVSSATPANGITLSPAIDGSTTVNISGGTASVNVIGSLSIDGTTATPGATLINYDLTANYN